MRNRFWPIPFAASLLLVGCAGPFKYTPRAMSGATWEASNIVVVVDDKRPVAATKLPVVPVVTLGGGQELDMRLPPEFSEFVRWRISQLVTRRGPRIRLLIVPEGVRAGWSATAWSESEKASVSLRFRILSEDGSRLLFEGQGRGQQDFKSNDASDDELAQVFRAACNDAFDDFFGSASNLQKLNAAAVADSSRPVAAAPSPAAIAPSPAAVAPSPASTLLPEAAP